MMGRSRGQRTRDKNKATLPQVPKQLKSDGIDVEYSAEFADRQLPPLRERLKWGLATPQKCKRTSSSFLDLGLHQGAG